MTASQLVSERAQLACWVSGILFTVLMFLGFFIVMKFFPPPSPMLNGEELMAHLEGNSFAIKFGIVLNIVGCCLLFPWSVLVAVQVRRMEGRRLPVLSSVALVGGFMNGLFFVLPFILWAGAFYRFDRNPELILLINDITWLEFVMIVPPIIMQMICISVAGFISSKEGRDVLPRWFLFLNLWVALLFVPGLLALFFFEGPFAWDGILVIWVPFIVFGIWWAAAIPVFFKAIKSHKNDPEFASI